MIKKNCFGRMECVVGVYGECTGVSNNSPWLLQENYASYFWPWAVRTFRVKGLVRVQGCPCAP